jgi:diguanylate cyclase (GGDEF)-like protein
MRVTTDRSRRLAADVERMRRPRGDVRATRGGAGPARRSLPLVAFAVAITVVALAAAGTIDALHRGVATRVESELSLTELVALVNQQSALEWEAVAARRAGPQLAARAAVLHRRLLAQIERARRLGGGDRPIVATLADAERYAAATQREMWLFAHGRVRAAGRVDDARADPLFERIARSIPPARVRLENRAAAANRLAQGGTYASLLGAALLVGLLLVFFARARRRAHEAFNDPLTGLANRALFTDRASNALALAKRRQERVAAIFLDIDDFKTINDSLGHAAGDQLLREIAARLTATVRESDTVARLGGDEFAVLLGAPVDTASMSSAARRIIAALDKSFVIAGKRLHVGATAGGALSLRDHDTDELLRDADLAMYAGKHQRKGRFVVYEPSMREAVNDRFQLEHDLGYVLEREELSLHYQPIVDISTGALVSIEALARWDHPERGRVPANVFIPLAEETGLIRPLGRWLLGQACAEAVKLQAAQSRPLTVHVNISPNQLGHEELVRYVAEVLQASGLPPGQLVLEITETTLAERGEALIAELEELAALGVRLAVDDFGVGYSSLAFLRRFPVQLLKIDRSFIKTVDDAEQGEAIVRSIVDLSHAIGLTSVAEGIEREEQLDALRDMGCESGQGFHLARPMPARELEKWLRKAQGEQTHRKVGSTVPRPLPEPRLAL